MADDAQPSTSEAGRGRGRGRGRPRGSGRGRGRGPGRPKQISYVTQTMGWSLKEKRKLLEGLKRYSQDDLDNLCRMVPTRSKKEMADYLKKLKGAYGFKHHVKYEAKLEWAPLESWLDLMTEMVHYEQQDLSKQMAQVFSILGNFSDVPEPTDPDTMPDFRKLYRYLHAIMEDAPELPQLTQLESAVILDLLHNIGDTLRMSDTSLQRKVICWKYKMLNHKYDFDDLKSNLDRIRKALSNDFSALQKNKGGEEQQQPLSGLTSAVGEPATPGSPDSIILNLGSPDRPSVSSSSAAQVDLTASPVLLGIQRLDGVSSSSSLDVTKSPQRSTAVTLPTTPQKSLATNQNILHTSPANHASLASVAVDLARSPEKTSRLPSETSQASPAASGASCQQSPASQNAGSTRTQVSPVSIKRVRRGRRRVHDWRKPLEKPRLYSMNPFCVPVRLLRFKSFLQDIPQQTVQISVPPKQSRSSSKMVTVPIVQRQPAGVPPGVDRLQLTSGRWLPVSSQGSVTVPSRGVQGSPMSQLMAGESSGRLRGYGTADGNQQISGSTQEAETAGNEIVTTVTHSVGHGKDQALSVSNLEGKIQPGQKYTVTHLPDGQLKLMLVNNSPASSLISPLRAPVSGRAISVGTSDDEKVRKLDKRRKAVEARRKGESLQRQRSKSSDVSARKRASSSDGGGCVSETLSTANSVAEREQGAVVVRRVNKRNSYHRYTGANISQDSNSNHGSSQTKAAEPRSSDASPSSSRPTSQNAATTSHSKAQNSAAGSAEPQPESTDLVEDEHISANFSTGTQKKYTRVPNRTPPVVFAPATVGSTTQGLPASAALLKIVQEKIMSKQGDAGVEPSGSIGGVAEVRSSGSYGSTQPNLSYAPSDDLYQLPSLHALERAAVRAKANPNTTHSPPLVCGNPPSSMQGVGTQNPPVQPQQTVSASQPVGAGSLQMGKVPMIFISPSASEETKQRAAMLAKYLSSASKQTGNQNAANNLDLSKLKFQKVQLPTASLLTGRQPGTKETVSRPVSVHTAEPTSTSQNSNTGFPVGSLEDSSSGRPANSAHTEGPSQPKSSKPATWDQASAHLSSASHRLPSQAPKPRGGRGRQSKYLTDPVVLAPAVPRVQQVKGKDGKDMDVYII